MIIKSIMTNHNMNSATKKVLQSGISKITILIQYSLGFLFWSASVFFGRKEHHAIWVHIFDDLSEIILICRRIIFLALAMI